ncbi:integral membrane protein GPR180 [Amblyraja radiata]|uniref:integral membrane protein GPR180 n=1 Tax=Amblyraja radiata TaxID=386614 RepID=UPI00140263A4|nr:integral membrane protein GPR180 [Amblyraja radiata]
MKLLILSTFAAVLVLMCDGKTVTGFFSSDMARQSGAQQVAKFLFHVSLDDVENNQTLAPFTHPEAYYIVYADKYTCLENEDKRDNDSFGAETIKFKLVLLNPDAANNPLDHFSAEESVPTKMHVIKMKNHCFSLKTATHHLLFFRYSVDGIGVPLLGGLAELCDMISQNQMLYMLLSLCMGWSLARMGRTQSRLLEWDSTPISTAIAIVAVITQGILLLWEQFEDIDHHSYHAFNSMASLLLMVLRVCLVLLLTSSLYQIITMERSVLKRNFYIRFAKGCILWLLCHPVFVAATLVFAEYQREKIIVIAVTFCQSVAMAILYRLFLSRSLYWEVSSLSSVILPLTMSSGHRCHYQS